MVTTAPSVETIRDGFPFPTIPKQPGLPTYETIKAVHMKLKANAASVPSALGGGNHGLLGLIISDAVYHTFTGNHFVLPNQPPPLPIVPAGTSAVNTGVLVREHAELLREYHETMRTDQALTQQVINTFDKIYTRSLRNRHTGYANVTAINIVEHLYTTYGRITSMDLEQNDIRMKAPYDPTQPIENLFNQLEEGQEYAEAGQAPLSTLQLINTAYLLVFKTGVYRDACRDWNRRTPITKTWANFKQDFNLANQELRDLQSLSHGAAGFQAPNHHANHVADKYQHQTLDVLRNLTDSSTADRLAVANLATANTKLAEDLASMKADMQNLLAKFTTLTNNTNNTNGTSNVISIRNRTGNDESYCWSHGRTRIPLHTSANCRNKKGGHIDTATLHNKQGGSTRYCN